MTLPLFPSIELAEPAWLLLLLALPAWAAWAYLRPSPTAVQLGDLEPIRQAPSSLWQRLRGLPTVLRVAVVVLAIVALARPQTHDVTEQQTTEGVTIMKVLDISSSMRATDFRPNRLVAARDVAREFVESRPDDQLGLMVFAARAYTLVPPTVDHRFLQNALADIDIGMVEDGTAIGTALASAVNRLRDADAESRVVVLLTDGENNRGEIDPLTATDVAAALNVRVYTVGVSSFADDEPFAPASMEPRSTTPDINEEMLQEMAQRTGGQYFRAGNREALSRVYRDISALETSTFETTTYRETHERYRLFLYPAFLLILLELLLRTTRLRRFP